MGKRKTREQFIEDARRIHGDRYDYSKVEYINADTKVCITCLKHGEFWQKTSNHLCGKGCPKCSGHHKRTNEEFIADARKVHGKKYDYSKCCFFTVATKVCIICPIHGEFLQTPLEHLRGYGCPKCAGVRYWNTEDYITKAKEVWGETYDYSQTRYNSFSDKVIITCPKHGAWECRPLDHIHGKHGCPRCAAMQRRKKVCGVGVIKDEGVVCNEAAYRAWRGMLKRCYNNPTEAYKNCVVCDDWLTYDNFREWYNPRYKEGWELDKDWLSRGNKIYSPETCCVIPPRLNQLIVRKLHKKHNLPHGVYLNSGSGRYFSTIGAKDETIYVGGGFNTPEEAFQAYKEAKESYIRREVEKYKDELEPRVYEAMMKYEV